MAMSAKEYSTLRKLMMQTLSDNDPEALQALRRANALLRAHSYDWNSAFDRIVRVDAGVEEAPSFPKRRAHIRELIESIEARDPRGKDADFLASVSAQFEKNGDLSDKQVASLERMA